MNEELNKVMRLAEGRRLLVQVVQELSLAKELSTIIGVVRRAARRLVGADGATFVLRDEGRCHYVDEDAIAPLWKGQRFPMSACISGWSMIHRRAVSIPDITLDARIPQDAYRPTFVKSLAMTPIRSVDPVGAIGVYWARKHEAGADELELLQALADTTSVAMENVALVQNLEADVARRTADLMAANHELQAFAAAAAHDLRAPLTAIMANAQYLQDDTCSAAELQDAVQDIVGSSERMRDLIASLLRLSQISFVELKREPLDLAKLAAQTAPQLQAADRAHHVRWVLAEHLECCADSGLMQSVVGNLLSNAFKYTRKTTAPEIEVGCAQTNKGRAFFVRDNGAGFDMAKAGRLFQPFQRLHEARDFEGTGVGLATVSRIIAKHGGSLWAEAKPGEGATFYFTVGA